MQCDDGCGDCCGLVPVTETEYKRVERYIKENDIVPQDNDDQCPFFQQGKCVVYPVRPLICQLFGHSEDPLMTCPHGYNVNVPEREVHRMLAGNGQATKTLHEFVPQFLEKAKTWHAQKLIEAIPEPEINLHEMANELRARIAPK